MIPLAKFFIPSFPYIPAAVKETKVITVFIPEELPEVLDPISANLLIREYKSTDDLVVKNIRHPGSELKAFPLRKTTGSGLQTGQRGQVSTFDTYTSTGIYIYLPAIDR